MEERRNGRGLFLGPIGGATRSPTIEVLKGGVAVALASTVLGGTVYILWLLGGQSGIGFLALVALAFLLLVSYSARSSSSIGRALRWFRHPDGIGLVAVLFSLVVTVAVAVV